MKQCFKCKEEKPFNEFYKHSRMADGHLNKCKECARADSTEHRNNNIEVIREYDRKRGNRQTPEYRKGYVERFPKKYKAQTAINNAVRSGKITRS